MPCFGPRDSQCYGRLLWSRPAELQRAAASPCLPIVNGIEDIQFSYACDVAVLLPGSWPYAEPDGRIDDVDLSLNLQSTGLHLEPDLEHSRR